MNLLRHRGDRYLALHRHVTLVTVSWRKTAAFVDKVSGRVVTKSLSIEAQVKPSVSVEMIQFKLFYMVNKGLESQVNWYSKQHFSYRLISTTVSVTCEQNGANFWKQIITRSMLTNSQRTVEKQRSPEANKMLGVNYRLQLVLQL